MIRLFCLKNGFYQEKSEKLEAQYSTLGYFDGLDTYLYEDDDLGILSDNYYPILYDKKNWQEQCDYFIVAGMRGDSDEDFWQNASGEFIFVSFVRLKERANNLQQIISEIETKWEAKCYLTYESSDMIVCLKTNCYSEGDGKIREITNIVREFSNTNRVQKSFSVVAIRQTVLNSILYGNVYNIKDEVVRCGLRCVVKDRTKIKGFIDLLKKNCKTNNPVLHNIMGSDDVEITLGDIRILDLLKLYADGEILTHWNKYYQQTFFNIRSEIAIREAV